MYLIKLILDDQKDAFSHHVNSLAVDCVFTSVLIYLLREGMYLACLVLFVRTRT